MLFIILLFLVLSSAVLLALKKDVSAILMLLLNVSLAVMMVGITVGIAWDENGNETFEDLPTRDDHPGSVEQMVLLALRTAAHAQ